MQEHLECRMMLISPCSSAIASLRVADLISIGETWHRATAPSYRAELHFSHVYFFGVTAERAELIPLAKSYIPEFSVLEMGEVSKRSATGPKAGSSSFDQ
jgi:hypothetical protein